MSESKSARPTTAATRAGGEALRLDSQDADVAERHCDIPGCSLGGAYRAPKSPSRLTDYFWFCLDHVRQYNKSWNYHAGLDDSQVEQSIRRSTTWERPSWPFGTRRESNRGFTGAGFADTFGLFEDEPASGADAGQVDARSGGANPRSPEARAFVVMGIDPPVTMDELKSRYKHLVKLNHPDRHGGDKDAEERLKLINEAYTTLKRFLT